MPLQRDRERAFCGGCCIRLPHPVLLLLASSTSSAIIKEVMALRDAGLGLTAYYYFDFRNKAKQDLRGLMSSLVVQLCAKSDSCYQILLRLYSTHDNGSQLPVDEALVQCLKDMLGLPAQPVIYLVMDALDECPSTSGVVSPRDLVLEFIEDLVELHLPNLRICVTSRPEADILEALGPFTSQTVSLHDEDGQKQDIVDYVTFVVYSDRKMRKWRAEDKKLVIDTISERADGMLVISLTYFVNSSYFTTGSDGFSVNSKHCVDVIPRLFGMLLTSYPRPWMRHTSARF